MLHFICKKVKQITEKSENSSLKVIIFFTIFRSSCWQKFYKVAENFTEKYLYRSLFLKTFQAGSLRLYEKRDSGTGFFL